MLEITRETDPRGTTPPTTVGSLWGRSDERRARADLNQVLEVGQRYLAKPSEDNLLSQPIGMTLNAELRRTGCYVACRATRTGRLNWLCSVRERVNRRLADWLGAVASEKLPPGFDVQRDARGGNGRLVETRWRMVK